MGPGLGQIAQVRYFHKKTPLFLFLNRVIQAGDYFNNFFIFYSSRYHANIQQECGIIVKTIKAEMKSDLIPLAEEKSNHGKVWFKWDVLKTVTLAVVEFWGKGSTGIMYMFSWFNFHLHTYFQKMPKISCRNGLAAMMP